MSNLEDFIITLKEHLSYRNNVKTHLKNLEATLWGLEEQASQPLNAAKEAQEELANKINESRVRINSLKELISNHEIKVKEIIKDFYNEDHV